jgi:hypothetical protein
MAAVERQAELDQSSSWAAVIVGNGQKRPLGARTQTVRLSVILRIIDTAFGKQSMNPERQWR